VIVHREEVYVRIQAENRRASKSIKEDLLGMVSLIKGKIKGKDDGATTPPEIGYRQGNRRRHPNRDGDSDQATNG